MDFVTNHFDSPVLFIEELKDILERKGAYDSPVSQVNAFLSLMVHYQEEFMDESGQDLVYCCYNLFDSDVFHRNTEVVMRSVIDRAIESSYDKDMWITYHVLLHAGKESPRIYRWMFRNEFFSKLKGQIQHQEGTRMQLIAIALMYEMCRIQTLKASDLALADETFLNYLLDLVEHTRTDDAELLNYGAIKLLLVFNEQYMLHTSSRPHNIQSGTKFAYSGNPLLTVLIDRLGRSVTFGENLIFMLNRAEETALQMLILKVLYLLFTSPSLYEFFYTNDLHVLVDVVIRELWDLPEEEESLRHAYLRVMGPLLTNTQLKRATYKRAEIVRLLRELGGGDLDSTLRRQLQEQQLREQLLEQQRALGAKFTYRDRESSSSPSVRWTSDRSGCSSPALSAEVEKKRGMGRSRLSMVECSSDSLMVPGQEEQAESLRQHLEFQQEHVSSPTDESPLQIEVPTIEFKYDRQPDNNISRSSQRAASPTTQRLVERVLREWLDNEMKNGAGTTGHGLSVRGVTDGHPTEAAHGRIAIPVAQ
ncbi:hypothetical protein KI688_012835 [Linnemannia hyalina]|uniref:SPIN90/Ldb17 leucine-rich domain-containing protein n=1 Tax=Linnemannia hyalina TaxID=64524 RepID=A0A9P8BT79_9FUNG|nr:hypothetical protein KI688_012835 [Linnemannia hyalina]